MEKEDREFRDRVAGQDHPRGRALAAEIENVTDQEINLAAETSYRRGFHQGVAAALEAVRAGFTDEKLARWENRVYVWRRKNHRGKPAHPEWLGRQ